MKSLIVFILSMFFTAGLMFSCSEDSTNLSRPTDGGNRDGGSGREDNTVQNSSCPENVKCSSSDCCKEDEDCKQACDDLFSGSAYTSCMNEYTIDTITKLKHIKENILDRPGPNELYEINTEDDNEPFCALLTLDAESWESDIEGYSPGIAAKVLEWMIARDVLSLLPSGDEGDDSAINIFETALISMSRAGSSESQDFKIFKALTEREISEKKTIFYIAENARNSNRGFNFIHDNLIKEGICDSSANRPEPQSSGEHSYTGPALSAANRYNLDACILALYCKAGPDDEFKRERQNAAKLLNDNVSDFIKTSTADGGLGVSDKANEWPSPACTKLQNYWNNNTSGFSLGLGSSS